MTLRKHDVVFRPGEPTREIYYLLQGRVKVARFSEHGKEQILQIAGAGDLFGEKGFGGGRVHTAQASAMEPAAVAVAKIQQLVDAVRRDPELAESLLSFFCRRLDDSENQIALLSFDTNARRLARFLLTQGRSGGKRNVPGWIHWRSPFPTKRSRKSWGPAGR